MIKTSGYAPKRAGQKLMVTVPSSDKLAQSAERALRMRQVGCRDVWELALVLAPLCAELAARRINADELAALERNTLARTREAVSAGAEDDRIPGARCQGFAQPGFDTGAGR